MALVIGNTGKSVQVKGAAYRLLRERTEQRVKQALQEYNPYHFFDFFRTIGEPSNCFFDGYFSKTISLDGQTIVSISGCKMLKVWNLQTGQIKHTLEGHLDQVTFLAISPDGQIPEVKRVFALS
jgi:WD40 repeat protein